MHNHKHVISVLLAVAVCLTASPAFGQIVYGQPVSADVRFIYSHWSQESDSISTDIDQFMIPVTGFFPLQDNLEFRFYLANASNSLDSGGTDYSLSGLSDVRLQINHSLLEDRLLFSAGLNLPTGKKKLSRDDERPVMNLLTQNYLRFPIRRLGEGFGLNLLAGAAAASGELTYGASAMYQINGAYEAYEGEGDYKPGNLFSLSVNADRRWDKFMLAADAILSTYGTDKLDDMKVFKQSRQLGLHAGGSYNEETFALNVDMRYLVRGRNTRYDAGEAIFDQLKIYGNEFSLTGRFAYSPARNWFVAPLADIRLIAGNEYEFGSSRNLGAGLEYGRNFGDGVDFGVGFKYFTGSADDGNIDLNGYQVSAGLTAAF